MTRELGGGADGENTGLKILSRNVLEEDVRRFLEMAQNLTSPGDRANIDAILQVSVTANYRFYEKMRGRETVMCEALRRLMKDEIQDEIQKSEKKGRQETLFGLVKDGILTLADAAKRADMKAADFEKAYKMFLL